MLFVKTDELNEVVLSHTDPMDPEYGLGKTEEELRAEGYLFEYLEELPRPIKKEGFRGVTYCDGEKFWFEYKEAGTADLQALMLRMEEVRTKDAARKKEVESLTKKTSTIEQAQVVAAEKIALTENQLGTISTKVTEAETKASQSLEKVVEVETSSVQALTEATTAKQLSEEISSKQASIESEQAVVKQEMESTKLSVQSMESVVATTKEDVNAAKEAATVAGERAEAVDIAGVERHEMVMQRVISEAGRVDNVDMTVSQSVMELMMAQMSIDAQSQQLSTHGLKIDEQGNIVGMTEEMMSQVLLENMMLQMDVMDLTGKVLSAEQEMVTTKEELAQTQEQLTQTQAEVAELILIVLEGGGTVA